MSFTLRTAVRTAIGAAAATALFPVPGAVAADTTGPSSSTAPYVQSVAPGVSTTSLLTTGDTVGGYRMAGIPDGIGVKLNWNTRQAEITLNHELGATAGVTRAHGQTGAFVSRWNVNYDKSVASGEDLVKTVSYWDYVTQTFGSTPSTGGANPRESGDTFPAQPAQFGRFCSGSLATRTQLRGYGGRGYDGNIWFGNEEVGDEGRLFGILDDGTAKQLPRLGLWSWENVRAATTYTNDTVLIGGEDTGDGQIWVYTGRKQKKGDAFRRAGLTTGSNWVIDMENAAVTNDAQFRSTFGKGNPAPFTLSDVDWDQSGARQNAEAKADGLSLNRIEDIHFDPRDPNTMYFVTTSGGDTTPNPAEPGVNRNGGGVWKVVFEDISDPTAGGTLELVLDGSEAPYLSAPDNIGMDNKGNLLIQEDPGNNAHIARIVAVDVDTLDRAVLTQFDPAQFTAGQPGFITQDEESSGIEYTGGFFGRNSWVFDAQVHKATNDPQTVEMGQLLSLSVNSWDDVYASGVQGTPGT